jgi:hypothetical protein
MASAREGRVGALVPSKRTESVFNSVRLGGEVLTAREDTGSAVSMQLISRPTTSNAVPVR